MTRSLFIFLSCILLLLPFIGMAGMVSISTQLFVCFPFILLLGIPHGAIDNILYRRTSSISNTNFIVTYLGLIGANVLLWILWPAMAYALFLIISAYHFGQSEFSHLITHQGVLSRTLYFFWGVTVLSSLIFLNHSEIAAVTPAYAELESIAVIHNLTLIRNILGVGIVMTTALIAVHYRAGFLSMESILMEILVVGAIMVVFYLLPLLIGFTVYFVIMHSVKVLREEYLVLKDSKMIRDVTGFIKMLLPLTIFSILGLLLLWMVVQMELIQTSYGYIVMISVSAITFPHVFVMNRFYRTIQASTKL